MPAGSVRPGAARRSPAGVPGRSGRWQRCVLAHHQIDQGGGAFDLCLRAGIGFRVLGHGIDAGATVATLHAQQAAVVHAVQQVRTGIAGAAPVVGHPAMRERLVNLARMHAAAFAHEGQHVRRAALGLSVPRAPGHARMHQRQMLAWQEAIVHQAIFLHRQARIAPLQITGAVVLHPMAQGQVLRACRCPDRVGLHETQAPDRGQQRGGFEQRTRHRIAAQIIEGGRGRHGRIVEARPAWLGPRRTVQRHPREACIYRSRDTSSEPITSARMPCLNSVITCPSSSSAMA